MEKDKEKKKEKRLKKTEEIKWMKEFLQGIKKRKKKLLA